MEIRKFKKIIQIQGRGSRGDVGVGGEMRLFLSF